MTKAKTNYSPTHLEARKRRIAAAKLEREQQLPSAPKKPTETHIVKATAIMNVYTVKNTTLYPGGHALDPGYRWTMVLTANGLREYGFYSDPDGSNARSIQTRPVVGGDFRHLGFANAETKRGDLEAAIKTHLERLPDERPSEHAMRMASQRFDWDKRKANEPDTLTILKELRSATVQFREEAYRQFPQLRVRAETVNMLSAWLLAAEKHIGGK